MTKVGFERLARKSIRVVGPAKPGELKVSYGRTARDNEPSVVYSHGGHGTNKGHANMLIHVFEELKVFDNLTLVDYLREAGYDLTTLKLSIQQKASSGP